MIERSFKLMCAWTYHYFGIECGKEGKKCYANSFTRQFNRIDEVSFIAKCFNYIRQTVASPFVFNDSKEFHELPSHYSLDRSLSHGNHWKNVCHLIFNFPAFFHFNQMKLKANVYREKQSRRNKNVHSNIKLLKPQKQQEKNQLIDWMI